MTHPTSSRNGSHTASTRYYAQLTCEDTIVSGIAWADEAGTGFTFVADDGSAYRAIPADRLTLCGQCALVDEARAETSQVTCEATVSFDYHGAHVSFFFSGPVSEVKAEVKAILARQRGQKGDTPPAVPEPSDNMPNTAMVSGEALVCHLHNERLWPRQGGKFYSHRTPDGKWCKGA